MNSIKIKWRFDFLFYLVLFYFAGGVGYPIAKVQAM